MLHTDVVELLTNRNLLHNFLSKIEAKNVLEIGVWEGENLLNMMQYPKAHFYGVDCYCNEKLPSVNPFYELTQHENEIAQRAAKELILYYPNLTLLYKKSSDAVNVFENEFFDFVYIDADHSYEACKNDIESWYPKVKIGGYMSGHDYKLIKMRGGGTFGVIQAVDEFVQEKKLHLGIMTCSSWIFKKLGK